MADSYSSMPLGEKNDQWTISAGGTENTWFVFNVGRQVYIEYYETNGNWSGYYNNSVAELFELSFYVKGGTGTGGETPDEPDTPDTPDDPNPPATGDDYVLTNELKAGDQVVIVCAAKNMALSSTYNGFYNAAVAVEPVDGVLTNPAAELVWTVGKNGDNYTFSFDGKNLGMADSYSSMPLGEKNDQWIISAGGTENTWFVFNVGRQVYIEYYETNGNWSGYYNNSVAELFELSFYVKGGAGTGGETPDTPDEPDTPDTPDTPTGDLVFEKVTSDLGDWSGSYVIGWDDGTTAYVFNGQADTDGNNVTSALTNNTVTASADCIIVIEASGNGYTFKATGGYLNGKTYDGAASNGMKFETEPAVGTITWENGNPIITSAAGTIMRYNNGTTYEGDGNYSWFRFFKPTSSVQTPVSLYKLTDGTPGETPDTPDVPVEPEDPDVPDTPVEGVEVFALTTELKDGDELVIYYPTESLVMGSNLDDRNRVVGIAAEVPTDGILTLPEGAVVFTVEYKDDTNFSLIASDGTYLTSGETGNSMSYAASESACSQWNLKAKEGTDLFYIYNSGANYNGNYNQAMEVFYSAFTTYGWKDSNIYEFQLYVKTVTDEAPCAHEWDNGTVTTPATCTEDGVLTITCSLCGDTKTQPIAALGHTDNDGDNACDTCGAVVGGDLVATAFEDIKATDTVIIVISGPVSGKDYVMFNTASDSAKGAGAEFDGKTIDETMFWNIVPCDGGYTVYKAGSTSEWLYLTNANNGVRVGNATTGNVFSFAAPYDGQNNYLCAADSTGTVRYIGAYDNNNGKTDVTFNFRSYAVGASTGVLSNIADQTYTFYVVGG